MSSFGGSRGLFWGFFFPALHARAPTPPRRTVIRCDRCTSRMRAIAATNNRGRTTLIGWVDDGGFFTLSSFFTCFFSHSHFAIPRQQLQWRACAFVRCLSRCSREAAAFFLSLVTYSMLVPHAVWMAALWTLRSLVCTGKPTPQVQSRIRKCGCALPSRG